jgi:thiol:disulfide interchange protein
MLLYAFIGGLILNIMPCVLPVIALKILGFVSEAKSSPRRVRALGGFTPSAFCFHFSSLAAIVIGVKPPDITPAGECNSAAPFSSSASPRSSRSSR